MLPSLHLFQGFSTDLSFYSMLLIPHQILFTMPLFNWNADRVSKVATPYAWIYLAVALPLTFVVLAIWVLWIWLSGVVHERADRDALATLRRSWRRRNSTLQEPGGSLESIEMPGPLSRSRTMNSIQGQRMGQGQQV